MNYLYAIDDFIILQFERVCHFTQLTFGMRSAHWVQLCRAVIVADLLRRVPVGGWAGFAWMMMAIIFSVGLLASIISDNFKVAGGAGMANPNKIRMRTGRLLYMAWFSIITYRGECELWFVMLALDDYFLACDDLPPGRSRFRKFLNSLQSIGMKPVEVGS